MHSTIFSTLPTLCCPWAFWSRYGFPGLTQPCATLGRWESAQQSLHPSPQPFVPGHSTGSSGGIWGSSSVLGCLSHAIPEPLGRGTHCSCPRGCVGWGSPILLPQSLHPLWDLSQQDVSAKKSLEFPELYMVGQQDELFNYRVFGVTLLQGVGTSLISFYITLWAFEDHVGTKAVGDYESFSVTVALSALLSVLMEVSTDLLLLILPTADLQGSWALALSAIWLGDDLPGMREEFGHSR